MHSSTQVLYQPPDGDISTLALFTPATYACRMLLSKSAIAESTWWRHQMETFSALLALCVGNSPITGEFPTQRPVTHVFFDLHLNKRLGKQSWSWWFESHLCSLWRHRNETSIFKHGCFSYAGKWCLSFGEYMLHCHLYPFMPSVTVRIFIAETCVLYRKPNQLNCNTRHKYIQNILS